MSQGHEARIVGMSLAMRVLTLLGRGPLTAHKADDPTGPLADAEYLW